MELLHGVWGGGYGYTNDEDHDTEKGERPEKRDRKGINQSIHPFIHSYADTASSLYKGSSKGALERPDTK